MVRGGEEECYEGDVALMRSFGHEVITYEQDNRRVAELPGWRVGVRTVWSGEDYRALRRTIRETRPDVVGIHNFFPLISPAACYAAKAEGVPVVQFLHNYRLNCPNGLFFRDGRVCEECLGRALPWPGVRYGCYRESKAASGAVSVMLGVHRALGTWAQKVDMFCSLTEFARRKYIEGGLPADKIMVKPPYLSAGTRPGDGRGGYAIFVGRLSPEKGLDILLAAWEQLGQRIPLKIVGAGPLAGQVAEAARRLPGVEWVGRKTLDEVCELVGGAAFLVFPSKWYETFGRVAIEAFAKGTPVIASRIGAIAELVEPGHTGLMFRPGDAPDLVAQVEWALDHPEQLARMRRAARAEFEAKYTAERNYEILMNIFERVTRGSGKHPLLRAP